MNKTSFIYITPQFLQTIKDSQVINWLEVLAENGIRFHLAVLTPLNYIRKHNTIRREKISKARKLLQGKIVQIPLVRAKFGTGISSLVIFSTLFIWVLANRIRGRKILIQTRSKNLNRILKSLKKLFPSTRIVFENRGAAAEEYLNSMNYTLVSEVTDERVIRQYRQILDRELISCKIADYVLCVSGKLRDYLISRFAETDIEESAGKYLVIPGAADENHFIFNQEVRDRTRLETGLNAGSRVIVYTGRLNCHWHKGDDMFRIMAICMEHDSHVYFMCITPDTHIADELKIENQMPGDRTMIRYIPYDDINPMLNAADFGLMLRDDLPTNNVASPTKVPEYLLCGLPVLISENIGDFSDFIEKNECGSLLPPSNEESAASILAILNNKYDRKKISETGRKHFSKQNQVRKILDAYNRITSNKTG